MSETRTIMLRRTILATLAALGIGAGSALAQGEGPDAEPTEPEGHDEAHVIDYAFSFEGPFGRFDQAQLQRGLQVYTEVCSACHGLKHVAYRTLSQRGGPNLPEDQMRAYAAQFEIEDPVTGEFRPAEPTDHFPDSQLDNAPDLSLMAKGRAGFHGPYGTGLNQLFRGMGGAEYSASVLTTYTGEEIEEAGVILYENAAFGGALAMPPPLMDDLVAYEDGTEATVEQMAMDVAAFMMWAAEPKMMVRKQAGLTAVVFLSVLAALLYLTNKKLWKPIKYRSG
jgi:ubiquinol-cytochrome c reductase cytochrome c1 subunit